MGQPAEETFRIGEYWIGKKSGKPAYYRYWYDPDRGVTRRASLGTSDFEEAKDKLAVWYVANRSIPERSELETVLLSDVIRRYYEKHGQHTQSHETSRANLLIWLDYFDPETTVHDATQPKAVDGFIRHLQDKGNKASYINRILTDGRSAINKAWKDGDIASAPFIKSLKVEDAEPKGRPLEMDELRAFYHTAETEHLKRFVLFSVATGARPSSVMDLHSQQIDLERRLIELNPPGRKQTKKIRPSVKLPAPLVPHVVDGWQITFRNKPLGSIKTSWRKQRARCGLDDQVNPYSIRHTIARHLRASGVPAWEVGAQLGHKKKENSITEIYAPMDPSYLGQALAAIEAFMEEFLLSPSERPLITLPLRCPSKNGPEAEAVVNIGAGDEIRTHDPNLGKVVLYP